MAAALDLRSMASSPAYEATALTVVAGVGGSPLKRLVEWFATRDRDANLASPEADIPAYPVVEREFKDLCKRLRDASSEQAFRHWRGASGTCLGLGLGLGLGVACMCSI